MNLRERFGGWLSAQPGYEQASIAAMAPVEGGASNLTYRVLLEGVPLAAVALRLQRDRGIFQPYDVIREARVVAALAETAVPVPAVVGMETSAEPLGAPFAVLEWVDAPHLGVAGPEGDFGAFTRMVAAIHSVDWRGPGFAMLPQPANAAEATRSEIATVAARVEAFGLHEPLLTRAQERLEASVPGDGRLALCQGDINVFNYLFRGGEVVAVVDWEQARIGDLRSDVGQLVALSHLKGAPFGPAEEMPFAQAYAAASGSNLTGLGYFRALWAWQLAFIHRAWVASNGSEPWYGWDDAAELLERSLEDLE